TGKPLGAFIAEQLGEQVSLGEEPDGEGVSQAKARYLLAEMEAVSAQLPGGLRRASDALWRYVAQRVPADPEVAAYDLSKLEDVVVRVSGPLAHVYFNVVTRPLDLIEVMLLYPNLLDRLFETGAVGLVAGRSGDKTVVMGPTGGMGVIGDGFVEMERQNPLAPFGDPAWVAGELHRVVGFSNAGDLLLLGKVFADGRVVTFEKQVSTHGGLGGAQGRPFIVYPPGSGPFETCSPEDLHRIFYEWHRHDGTVVGTGAGIAGMTA
ncbi:MAG: hypothetical protein JXD18_08715, partial [Anaerolineae bacterium]|nr:hypothetical protein [Anaerolineae bacterium]